MKLFIDSTNHPQVRSLVLGQKVTLTLQCSVDSASEGGVNLAIEGIKVGKKGKMNTQEIMLANRLQRIEDKMPGQAVTM